MAVTLALAATFASAAGARSPSAALIDRVNDVRVDHGLRPLEPSPSLLQSAQHFSGWLMGHDLFEHRASGVSVQGDFRRSAEAIAMHYSRGAAIAATVRGWLASPTHRPLLLDRAVTLIGAGVTRGDFAGRGATIWVLQTAHR
jgi:uncharacterized protein YkwD